MAKSRTRNKSKGYKKGTYVWIPDDALVMTPGKVVKTFKKGQSGMVVLIEKNNEEMKLSSKQTNDLMKCDKKTLQPSSDLTKLRQLNEYSILFALRKRFSEDTIYTALGPVLVSVNPFKQLPLYSPDILEKYMNGVPNLDPHVFQVAQRNYSQMVNNRKNQCCIVTGESGAGKTEATKSILQFLTEKSSSRSPGSRDKSQELSKKILDMNPLLEAFGNAKTGRNNNSSRFGKLTQMQFNANSGEVVGVGIVDYLLEKSRIVSQQPGERNYHVFYQLCTAATQNLLPESDLSYELKYAENYFYLTQTADPDQTTVPGMNDAEDWRKTYDAMSSVGIDGQERRDVISILVGVLYLGNVQFDSDGDADPAYVRSDEILGRAAKVLGFSERDLLDGLLKTKISTTKDTTYREHTVQQANDARDALAKSIYSNLFETLIERINEGLKVADGLNTLTINVLDIFGFEEFDFNSFEQLNINYCNEKLQVHFVDNIFKFEQEAYRKEGIEVKDIEFEDNAEVLQVIEDKVRGVYAILDEQNRLPNGSDEMFLKKLLDQGVGVEKRQAAKLKTPNVNEIRRKPFMQYNFNVVHFAGEVSYNVANFLEKNSDRLLPSLEDTVAKSTNPFIEKIYSTQPKAQAGRGKKLTLGMKFQRQLDDLMQVLNSSEPHFVRTIKPNVEKTMGRFTSDMVLQQIRCAGLLGVCEVHKRGYPVRYDFQEFVDRYTMLIGGKPYDCEQLANSLEGAGVLEKGEYQIGKTQIFLRNLMQEELENLRDDKLGVYAIKLQKVARGFIVRRRFIQVVKLAQELNKALEAGDADELRALIEYSTNIPKDGNLRNLILEAKSAIADIDATADVVAKLKIAVENQDRNVIQSLLGTLEEAGMENVQRKSVIFEAEKLLEMMNNGEEQFNYDINSQDMDDVMHIIWEKMSGNFGVNNNDIKQLNAMLDQLDEEGDDEMMQKAEKLLEIAELQLDAQEILRNALDTRDDDDLRDAMELIQDLDLNTNDAKRVQNLVLKNNLQNQDAAPAAPGNVNLSNLVNLQNLSVRLNKNDIAGQANMGRVSAVVNMSDRLSKVNRMSAVGFGSLGPRFAARPESAIMVPRNDKMRAMSARMDGISNKFDARPESNMRENTMQKPKNIRQTMALMNNEMMKGRVEEAAEMQLNKFQLDKFYQIREDEDFYEGIGLSAKETEPKLKWTGKPINKSITLLNAENNKLAIQINKSILQFCGDTQFQYPNLSARFVLVTALENPVLVDEVYMQILKSITGNTRVNSEDRAWILLILATQQFAPSPDFEPYLFSFLLSLKDTPLLIGNYAKLCIVQLDRTLELGTSNELPDVDVIAAYASRPALLLSLKQPLVEETIDIPVYPDVDVETIVQNAFEFAQLGGGNEQASSYGLFIIGSAIKVKSQFASRLENFYLKWDQDKLQHVDYFAAVWSSREDELFKQLIKKYGPEPPMNPMNKRQSFDPSKVKADISDDNLSQPLPWFVFPGDVFLQMTLKGKQPVFYLKRKLFSPSDISKGSREVVDLLIEQISCGELAIKDYDDIALIAAIALTLKNGGQPNSVGQLKQIGLEYILPQIWLNAQSGDDTAMYILEKCQEISNMRPRDMLTTFLQTASKADGYARWFYPITAALENGEESVAGSAEISQDAAYVAVGYTGVGVFDGTRTECMFEYKFEEIDEYGASSEDFWMNLKSSGTNVTFETELPWEIYSIIYDYIQSRSQGQGQGMDPRTTFNRNSVMRMKNY